MPRRCLHCDERRGNRRCPALGGSICSRCCGENRLVAIACPPSCIYLAQHEAFQQRKQSVHFAETWRRVNADLRGREEALRLQVFIEQLLAGAARGLDTVVDRDVLTALDDLHRLLSPIELVAGATSTLARRLWGSVAPLIEDGTLRREALIEGIDRLRRLVEALQDPAVPRAFLQGLLAQHAGDEGSAAPEAERGSGLIVTPEDLRRSASRSARAR